MSAQVLCHMDASDTIIYVSQKMQTVPTQVKEHALPPCLVLVIDDNPYGLMVALSYI